MAYATYSFYIDSWHGDELTSAEFDKYADRASDYIDRVTLNKAKSYNDVDNLLKKACCAASEQLKAIGAARTLPAEVASETVGSHSVTYRSNAETVKGLEAQLYQIVLGYLAATGLMYRGVNVVRSTYCNAYNR